MHSRHLAVLPRILRTLVLPDFLRRSEELGWRRDKVYYRSPPPSCQNRELQCRSPGRPHALTRLRPPSQQSCSRRHPSTCERCVRTDGSSCAWHLHLCKKGGRVQTNGAFETCRGTVAEEGRVRRTAVSTGCGVLRGAEAGATLEGARSPLLLIAACVRSLGWGLCLRAGGCQRLSFS